MGCRGQVKFQDTNVYLYTHWGATDLPNIVQASLRRRWRWNDPEYLARIVFDEMTRGSHDQETGYGIGTEEHGDIEMLVTLNCKEREVKIQDLYNGSEKFYSFDKYCDEKGVI